MTFEVVKKIVDKEEIKREMSKYQICLEDIEHLKIKNIDGKIYVEVKVKKCL